MRALLLFLLPALAAASAAGGAPTIDHTPVNRLRSGTAARLYASVAGGGRVERLVALVRAADRTGDFEEIPFGRDDKDRYVAEIPVAMIGSVGLHYAIESTGPEGARRAHFASREAPHLVTVSGQSDAEAQAEQLARYAGSRSRLRLAGGAVVYGTTDLVEGETDDGSDHYWQIDAEYTYRPLRLIHDFRLGFHTMRGGWPEVDGEPVESGRDPGLYWAHGELNLEIHRWFSVGGRVIMGVNEAGFVGGGGGVVRVGDIAGTHFAGTVDGILEVGYVADLRFHWTTVPRFPMALGVEFTDWPGADRSAEAANLSYDVAWQMTDAFAVGLRLGSAARQESLTGGYQGRLTLDASF